MPNRRRRDESPNLVRSEALSKLIRTRREKVEKISQTELARRAGVSVGTIRQIENNVVKEPGLFTIIDIAVALRLDLSEMMTTKTGPLRARSIREKPTSASAP